MSNWNKSIIEEFRANKGKVGGYFANSNLLLLHTKGAKSGLERINPVAYFIDDNYYVIIASKSGANNNPDWYHNLLANPEISVEVGTEQFQVIAKAASEPERTRLYEKMESINPGFSDYKQKTSRVIPVFTLTRKS
jgi:deazaflavin-dependent oxidoreductase (nitroreductase family)